MFYCNDCGEKRDWPIDTLFKSVGPCEICKVTSLCNDVPSKYLPAPKQLGDGIQNIRLGGNND